MPKISTVVKDFYGEKTYDGLLVKAETSKFNGFDIPKLTKAELMAVIGDLLDLENMSKERIDELEDMLNATNVELSDLQSSYDDLVETLNSVSEPVKDPSLPDRVITKESELGRPIDVKEKVGIEDINSGPLNTHQYKDWN